MPAKKKSRAARILGPLELDVMKAVWELEDVSVAEVLERLRETREIHHNTVMTTMQRLAKKRFLTRYARDGRTNGYRPRVQREELCGDYVHLVREHFFRGSLSATVAGLIGSDRLSRKKRAKLEQLLEEIDDEGDD